MKNKKYILLGLIAILFGLFVIIKFEEKQRKKIVFDRSISDIDYASDFTLTTNSILIFDNKNLYFCDKDGSFTKVLNLKEKNVDVFFANNYAFLYDKDINKVYQYRDTGEYIATIPLKEELYNVSYKNKEIIFHLKTKDREDLKILKQDASLSDLYSTENTILAYDLYSIDEFSVSEIYKDAKGYKSLLYMKNKDDHKLEDYSNEVILYVYRYKDKTIMASDKSLYLYEKNKNLKSDIPNISDIQVSDRNIYLLHSNIISRFNFSLEETEKIILSANLEKMFFVANSLYAYGPSDIGGELGSSKQFYTRLGTKVDKIDVSGLTVASLKDGKINLYKISNERSLGSDIND